MTEDERRKIAWVISVVAVGINAGLLAVAEQIRTGEGLPPAKPRPARKVSPG